MRWVYPDFILPVRERDMQAELYPRRLTACWRRRESPKRGRSECRKSNVERSNSGLRSSDPQTLIRQLADQTLRPSDSLLHAPYSMPHAPCSMPHAPCPMLHAPCSMLHAPCPMPHAPCSLLHAPCPML